MPNLPLGYQMTMTPNWLNTIGDTLLGVTGLSVWTNDNPSVVTMVPSTGNTYATITSTNTFGTANVTVTLGSLSVTEEFVCQSPAGVNVILGPPTPAGTAIGTV